LLKQIKHPGIDLDIVELGMIGKIREGSGKVIIEFRLPFRGIPKKQMIMDQIKEILNDRVVEVKPCLMNREHKARFIELAQENWGP